MRGLRSQGRLSHGSQQRSFELISDAWLCVSVNRRPVRRELAGAVTGTVRVGGLKPRKLPLHDELATTIFRHVHFPFGFPPLCGKPIPANGGRNDSLVQVDGYGGEAYFVRILL